MTLQSFNIQRRRHAFTLVEILIVVAILGILAAIVTPKFVDASGEAKENSVKAQLRTIRGQIALYKQEYGVNPDMTSWNALSNTGFLPGAPVNPMNDNTAVSSAPGATVGWVWRKVTPAGSTWELYATGDPPTAEWSE